MGSITTNPLVSSAGPPPSDTKIGRVLKKKTGNKQNVVKVAAKKASVKRGRKAKRISTTRRTVD